MKREVLVTYLMLAFWSGVSSGVWLGGCGVKAQEKGSTVTTTPNTGINGETVSQKNKIYWAGTEAFDVEPVDEKVPCASSFSPGNTINMPACGATYFLENDGKNPYLTYKSCRDKRRVLLHTEDGVEHCFAMWLVKP